MAFSEMIDELFEDLPLLACERESEYDDLLSLALVIPDINDWDDVLGVKQAVDCIWRVARYCYLYNVATTADRRADDAATLARELDLPAESAKHLVYILRAGSAYGASDWKPDFKRDAVNEVGSSNSGRGGNEPLQASISRALKQCEAERADALSDIELRNPALAETLRDLSDKYLAWRLSLHLHRSRSHGSFEDVWRPEPQDI